MRQDTPPMSPNSIHPEDDDDLVYVGDDIDEVIELLEGLPDNEEPNDEDDEEGMEEEMEEDDNVIPERDDSILTFSKHSDSLFCGSFSPNGELVVTGGEDDKAFVWNIETGDVVFEVTEHKDSVISAEFSYDGTFLATGDMAGEIKAFKVDKGYKKVWEFSIGDMSWLKWHTKANVLMAGSDTGEIYIWRIPSGDCKVLQGSGAKCEVAMLTSDSLKLAAGYGDGCFKLWDIKTAQLVYNCPPETKKVDENEDETAEKVVEDEESQAITTIDTDRENNLIIAGGVNGIAKLFSSTGIVGVLSASGGLRSIAGRPVVESSPVEKVLLDCPDFDLKVACTGSLNGKVFIWDAAHQSIRNECQDDDPAGITTMLWAKEQTLIAGTLGGSIKAWNIRDGRMKYTLLGHANNIHDLRYNEKKNLLLAVSEDRTAKLFRLPM